MKIFTSIITVLFFIHSISTLKVFTRNKYSNVNYLINKFSKINPDNYIVENKTSNLYSIRSNFTSNKYVYTYNTMVIKDILFNKLYTQNFITKHRINIITNWLNKITTSFCHIQNSSIENNYENSIKIKGENENNENPLLYLNNIKLSNTLTAIFYSNGANFKKNYLLLNYNFNNHPFKNDIITDIQSKIGVYAYKQVKETEHELVLYEIKISNISISSKWDDGKVDIIIGTLLNTPGYISTARFNIQIIDRKNNEIIRSIDCNATGIKFFTEEEANADVYKNRIGYVIIKTLYDFFPPLYEIKDITAYNKNGEVKEFTTAFGSNHGLINSFEYNVIGKKGILYTLLGTAKIKGDLGIIHSTFTVITGDMDIANAVNNGSKIFIINKTIQIPVINY